MILSKCSTKSLLFLNTAKFHNIKLISYSVHSVVQYLCVLDQKIWGGPLAFWLNIENDSIGFFKIWNIQIYGN